MKKSKIDDLIVKAFALAPKSELALILEMRIEIEKTILELNETVVKKFFMLSADTRAAIMSIAETIGSDLIRRMLMGDKNGISELLLMRARQLDDALRIALGNDGNVDVS